jgi:predicted dehydrogenase
MTKKIAVLGTGAIPKYHLDKFLNSENTESVSGSSQKSGVLHAVRDRNANDQVAPKELEPVAEALEIRTHPESFYCNDDNTIKWGTIERCLKQCDDCKLQETEG